MPQPTTHYLVIRRAIPEKYWPIWWDRYKPFFGLGSSAPDLFYFPKLSLWRNYSSDLSDSIHSEHSYDIFCNMLDIAKDNKSNAQDYTAEKQFAFSVGFYAHVVTDCIFHPYVYRNTEDHWATSNFLNELKHKQEEFRIDRGIHRMVHGRNQDIGSTDWKCPGPSNNLLDPSIATLFNQALSTSFSHYLPSQNINDSYHPIQQAYDSLNDLIPHLFNGQKMFLWGRGEQLDTSGIEDDEHFFTRHYSCIGLEPYTPQDLFNFSCAACQGVFLKALEFFNEPYESSSQQYFYQHQTDYLGQGNWNLDTGLPCDYNNHRQIMTECPEHYSYKVEELQSRFYTISQRSTQLYFA